MRVSHNIASSAIGNYEGIYDLWPAVLSNDDRIQVHFSDPGEVKGQVAQSDQERSKGLFVDRCHAAVASEDLSEWGGFKQGESIAAT